jgi:hypothetical protein
MKFFLEGKKHPLILRRRCKKLENWKTRKKNWKIGKRGKKLSKAFKTTPFQPAVLISPLLCVLASPPSPSSAGQFGRGQMPVKGGYPKLGDRPHIFLSGVVPQTAVFCCNSVVRCITSEGHSVARYGPRGAAAVTAKLRVFPDLRHTIEYARMLEARHQLCQWLPVIFFFLTTAIYIHIYMYIYISPR